MNNCLLAPRLRYSCVELLKFTLTTFAPKFNIIITTPAKYLLLFKLDTLLFIKLINPLIYSIVLPLLVFLDPPNIPCGVIVHPGEGGLVEQFNFDVCLFFPIYIIVLK